MGNSQGEESDKSAASGEKLAVPRLETGVAAEPVSERVTEDQARPTVSPNPENAPVPESEIGKAVRIATVYERMAGASRMEKVPVTDSESSPVSEANPTNVIDSEVTEGTVDTEKTATVPTKETVAKEAFVAGQRERYVAKSIVWESASGKEAAHQEKPINTSASSETGKVNAILSSDGEIVAQAGNEAKPARENRSTGNSTGKNVSPA